MLDVDSNRRVTVAPDAAAPGGASLQDEAHGRAPDPIDEALRLAVPSWPLQNAVAVNPFWNRREERFSTLMQELSLIVHAELYMPLHYYLDRYRSGVVSRAAVAVALSQAATRLKSVPVDVDEFLRLSAIEVDAIRHVPTIAESHTVKAALEWQKICVDQASKYASAFFDESQAMTPFPWRKSSFWRGWVAALPHDRSMEFFGLDGFRTALAGYGHCDAREFIGRVLDEVRLYDRHERTAYLSRLLTTSLGWSTQFGYGQWQRSLGYEQQAVDPAEYLAVLLAYDFGVAKCLAEPTALQRWRDALAAARHDGASDVQLFGLQEVWLMAMEASYQAAVAAKIDPTASGDASPRVQVVTCIDVRSEPLRRAIESTSSGIATIGFAGFFGLPMDHHRADERRVAHRLPVLLGPVMHVEETPSPALAAKMKVQAVRRAFFRNLRKAPLASFFFVEVFGIYAVANILRRVWAGMFAPRASAELPDRFRPCGALAIKGMGLGDKVERAATVLRHMGLRDNFARLVVMAGHGHVSVNNAFASGLDCGACGGHAGDVNARLLVDLLNDSDVRSGLAGLGIHIPASTWFVAALHETVSDRVHLLEPERVPATHRGDLALLQADLDVACRRVRAERQSGLARGLDEAIERRMRNWSEVRPEWGLAGNASFVVAPRAWTKGASLEGRAFLHDYDASRDQGFATLELIMTAPMIVTNWINMQYYASTVAPSVYGAGDKTLHNLVNESGVQEGNGGDLRVGLPIQSVHDGDAFVHEPLRLSVFVAAPRDAIEAIVAKHKVVRDLVENEWLHLLQIDAESGVVAKRLPGGFYTQLPMTPV